MARVSAKHPEWKAQSSKRGTRGEKINPATTDECKVDDVDFRKCWETGACWAAKAVLQVPQLMFQSHLFEQWAFEGLHHFATLWDPFEELWWGQPSL